MRYIVLFTALIVTMATLIGCKKSSSGGGPGPEPCSGVQETEPNDDTPQSAGTLGDNDIIVCGTAAHANDVDRYSVVVAGSVNLHASVAWTGGADLDLSIRQHPDLYVINHQDTGANPERCTLPSLSPGTYVIEVTSKTAASVAYTLTIGKR